MHDVNTYFTDEWGPFYPFFTVKRDKAIELLSLIQNHLKRLAGSAECSSTEKVIRWSELCREVNPFTPEWHVMLS